MPGLHVKACWCLLALTDPTPVTLGDKMAAYIYRGPGTSDVIRGQDGGLRWPTVAALYETGGGPLREVGLILYYTRVIQYSVRYAIHAVPIKVGDLHTIDLQHMRPIF